MKKVGLITLLSCSLGFDMDAQTLTYANFSNVLSTVQAIRVADLNSYNTVWNLQTGNGVTWNAASLTPANASPVINMGYYNPSTTPYAALYPTSNYSRYDPALTSVIEYLFLHVSADSVVEFGTYAPSTAHEIYQDPDKRLIFPFAYGQTFTDNYAKTNYSNATTISSFQTGTRTVTFNGFGTLILPQGSFSNVALISELRTNSLGPNSDVYTWIDITNGKTLMMYSSNNGNITAVYSNDLPSSIAESNAQSVSLLVFPNPCHSNLRIKLSEQPHGEAVYEIYSGLGTLLMNGKLSSNQHEINIEALETGLYFIKATSGSYTAVSRFVKE